MRRWNADLERREAARMPTRLPCAVWVGSVRHAGMLEQASAHSVGVRMEKLLPGSHEAKLTFSTPKGVHFALRAVPVRGHVAAHTLRGVLAPWVVLQVRVPADAYLRWLNTPVLDVS